MDRIRGVCYACGDPAGHECGMCDTAACSGHAEPLPGFDAPFCRECAQAMLLLVSKRRTG